VVFGQVCFGKGRLGDVNAASPSQGPRITDEGELQLIATGMCK